MLLPEHSEHGASSCARWWNCPGSTAMTRTMPNETSIYAAEGTAAHELAAMCLMSGQDAEEYTGRTVAGFNVDAAMAEAVQVYLDQCRVIMATSPDVRHLIEHRFTLADLAPPAPMYGTADFVASYAGTLWVVDLKYGQGHQVQAEGNPQLRYYALGALLSHDGPPIHAITAMIVQPRAPGGPAVRTAFLDPVELVEWSVELMDRAAATLQPDAPFVPGEWCKASFCKARGTCTARRDVAMPPAGPLPDPRLMTSAQVSHALGLAGLLEDFLRDLRAAATAELSRGGVIPGWKLVPTRPSQSWRDEATADAMLEDVLGFGDTRYQPRKLVSPAQARDALADDIRARRKVTKKAATEEAWEALAELILTASSGTNLAPDADARLALPAAGSEFTTSLEST